MCLVDWESIIVVVLGWMERKAGWQMGCQIEYIENYNKGVQMSHFSKKNI
jgi:hypothetical protein